MATPSFLRDLSPRVKSLGSPVVWAPLTICVLLGIFVWEFSKNPDWFNREQVSNLNPNSTLTPEEQARLSEIDTIDLLIEQSRVPDGTPEATSIINPDAPELEAAASEADAETDSRQLSGREDPFGEYEAEYAFPGSANSQTSTLTPPSAVSSGGSNLGGSSLGGSGLATSRGSGESFNFGTGLVNPSAPATNSALSDALGRQQAARAAAEQAEQDGATSSVNGLGTAPPSISGSTADVSQSGSQTNRLPAVGQPGSQPIESFSPQPAVRSRNLSVPFSPSTFNTSPPAGTTGYQVPATSNLPVFNVPPQQPTPNPFPARPSETQTPQSETLYTAPTSIQPAQNQQRR